MQDDADNGSAVYPSTSKLQVDSLAEPAAFQVNVPFNDTSGPSFITGDTSRSNLRMGVDPEFSWIQSHGGKPLQVNPIGNDVVIGLTASTANVGIGTESPQAKLDVNGSVRTDCGRTRAGTRWLPTMRAPISTQPCPSPTFRP